MNTAGSGDPSLVGIAGSSVGLFSVFMQAARIDTQLHETTNAVHHRAVCAPERQTGRGRRRRLEGGCLRAVLAEARLDVGFCVVGSKRGSTLRYPGH